MPPQRACGRRGDGNTGAQGNKSEGTAFPEPMGSFPTAPGPPSCLCPSQPGWSPLAAPVTTAALPLLRCPTQGERGTWQPQPPAAMREQEPTGKAGQQSAEAAWGRGEEERAANEWHWAGGHQAWHYRAPCWTLGQGMPCCEELMPLLSPLRSSTPMPRTFAGETVSQGASDAAEQERWPVK